MSMMSCPITSWLWSLTVVVDKTWKKNWNFFSVMQQTVSAPGSSESWTSWRMPKRRQRMEKGIYCFQSFTELMNFKPNLIIRSESESETPKDKKLDDYDEDEVKRSKKEEKKSDIGSKLEKIAAGKEITPERKNEKKKKSRKKSPSRSPSPPRRKEEKKVEKKKRHHSNRSRSYSRSRSRSRSPRSRSRRDSKKDSRHRSRWVLSHASSAQGSTPRLILNYTSFTNKFS